ncbi:ribonuclease H-like domain-containing protein, partial [Paraphysoderma sedebokerense]
MSSFRYLLVLDFEATCDENKKIENEVIEFPIVVVDTQSIKVIDEFRRYVKPLRNPTLTKFCTSLTGITQDLVDNSETFDVVFKQVQEFLKPYINEGLFVTCGDWDLKHMLPKQAEMYAIDIPDSMKRWNNIKVSFCEAYGLKKRMGMDMMLDYMGLELLGRHHSGLDDCRNIARIAIKLITD